MKKQKGFSLIELLIVVAIILIIAAIAIPNLLRSRIAANEASAASSIRTITTAEITYATQYQTIGFAAKLADLGGGTVPCVPVETGACLIDNNLATNGTPANSGKSGYFIAATGTAGSGGGGANTLFAASATPLTYNGTGINSFCAVEDGAVRKKNDAGTAKTALDHGTCVAYPPM